VVGNLWYDKALVKNCKPSKAILVLKSIAKIFTPIPFMSLPFTRTLQRASSVQQLKDPSTVNFHVYDSYKHSFSSARELNFKLIDDQDAPVPETGMFGQRRLGKTLTQGVEKFQKFFVFSQETSHDDFENLELIPQVQGEEFTGISVYSKPRFLYLIGKYALRFQTMVNDGVCALKDFLEITRAKKQSPSVLNQLAKAENVLKLLSAYRESN
jgi:hypothetical protein